MKEDKDTKLDGQTEKSVQHDDTQQPDKVVQEEHASEHEPLTLKEIIKEQATEDEAPQARTFSLRKILGGDILNTTFMRRQVWLCLLIAFFMVIYIANRYSCQKDIIEIDKLQTELQDAKYKALSSNSQLTEKSRQSNVLQLLRDNKDSVLKLPTLPPYIITVPEK